MGPTVTLTKVANHAAKKLKLFNGVCVIDNDALRRDVLSKMDVADIWEIGRKLSTKLRVMKVKTALDLALLSPERARREFSVEVERTIRELNGLSCI
jgi:DNA polymerase V